MKNQKCSFLHMLVKVDLNKTHADVPWNLRKLMEKVSDCYPITGSSSSQKSNFFVLVSYLFLQWSYFMILFQTCKEKRAVFMRQPSAPW